MTLDKTGKSIGEESASIVVYDEGLVHNPEHRLYKYLEKEGFSLWNYSKGFYDGVGWVFVNINNKLVARGMPGIKVTKHIGNHAVTVDEFITIYEIFKKYEGYKMLEFPERL